MRSTRCSSFKLDFVPQPDGIVGGHVKFLVQALWSLILMVGGLPAVGDVSRSLTQGSRSLIVEISGRVRAEAGRSWAQCTVELLSFTYNKETHGVLNGAAAAALRPLHNRVRVCVRERDRQRERLQTRLRV